MLPIANFPLTKESIIASVRNRRLGRSSAIGLALFVTASFFLIVLALAHTVAWRAIIPTPPEPELPEEPKPIPVPRVGTCHAKSHADSPDIWKAAQKKYKDLMDDKFTIALQTYHRPEELNGTLSVILGAEVPSLHEVVIVWNNLDEEPPANFVSAYGVPVRYRVSPVNSLNQKLVPDPKIKTQAVLLSDDDVYYWPEDLEWVFQTWRRFGRKSLTGAMPRCVDVDDEGEWRYRFCPRERDEYNLIITNLAFSHMSFLDYYSSADPIVTKIRGYVDEHFNCEDIAMNYLHARLTGEGPLLVHGNKAWFSGEPKEGISRKKGHMERRSQCLNDFAELFGCMPLVNETVRMERGHW
ncbi:exostosin-2 [Plectosphaerella plurivora]|uniref:Exostosin-2 n=1 Tax=Plectosphaerella plurivora TaxID=936078 RepID=A0A9P9AH41_9PEZI|nr:exostosin-2 [Plectosphaerella plurivora]